VEKSAFVRACLSYVRVIMATHVCSFGGTTMLDDDETDSSSQLSTVRCTWMRAALSYCVMHSMPLPFEDPTQ
jgi:hypothetical protein